MKYMYLKFLNAIANLRKGIVKNSIAKAPFFNISASNLHVKFYNISLTSFSLTNQEDFKNLLKEKYNARLS